MGETDGKFLPTVFKTLGTHSGIGEHFGHALQQVLSMWHWVELPNNENFYSTKLYAPVLGLMPVTFFTLSPWPSSDWCWPGSTVPRVPSTCWSSQA